MDDSLAVPSRLAALAVGKELKSAGTWMSPPPPTTASTNPANRAAKAKTTHTSRPQASSPITDPNCAMIAS